MEKNNFKILVVDDLQDNLITLDTLIKDVFPETIVLKAQTGETGLELATKENPDVILLDILMPEMDGYEVCQKLKADKELCDIPVVFVTAIENNKEALVKALESGGETFLTKPIDEIELTAQIRAMLKIREANNARKDEKIRLEKLVEERSKELVKELDARKQAEEERRLSEERFRVAQEISPDGFTILHPIRNNNGEVVDFTWVYENLAIAQINGTDPDKVKGKRLLELFPAHIGTPLFELYISTANTGKQHIIEEVYVGEIVSVPTYLRLVIVSMGNDIAILAQNITKRKQAEEKLKESEERFRNLVNTINSGVAIYKVMNQGKSGSDYIIQDFNQFALKHENMNKEEVIGKSLKDIRPNIDEYGLIDVFRKVWETGESTYFPAKVYIDEKYSNYYENRVFKLPSGEIVAVYDDVTERERAELALKESEERLDLAMMIKNEGIWDWYLLTNQVDFDHRYYTMAGYDPGDFANNLEEFQKRIHPEDKDNVMSTAEQYLAGQIEQFQVEFRFRCKDGSWIWIQGRGQIVERDEKGIPLRFIGTHSDITERKQAEEKIIQQNEFLINVMESLTHPFYVIDVNDYSIIQGNSASGFSAGPNQTSCHGLTHNSAVPCNSQDHPCPLEIVKKTRQPATFEHIHFDEAGNKRNVEVYCYPIFDKNGVIRSAIEYSLDITLRKKAESELVKLSTAVTQSPSVIAITDTKGNLQYVNPKFTESTGYSVDEAIGQNPRILKSGKQSDEIYKELWQTISSGKVWRGEFHNKKKNGQLFWELASVSPIFNEQGKIINYIKVAEDITERKLAEDNFRHSIDESPLGVRIVNQAGKTIYVNKALLDIYEFSSVDEFLNTSAIERYTELSYKEHQERKKIRQEGGDTSDYEISIRRKNGEIRHIKVWRKEVIWNKENHYQVINQDITELKRLNTDLILAKEKAEESNRLKTAFLNNMSHEIRTPLNGITGFIRLLQDSEIDDKQKQHYFDIINKSSDRLIATVTDIIDISRIEAGEVKVSQTEVSVNEILEEQYSFFYHQAQSKGLELIYKPCLSESEACFVTDKHKLEGILTNLIKNAIKFTEQGEITFACSLKKEQDIEVLEFYVKDTGIGIPANRIDAVFNRFEQADIEDKKVHQGSGLGLAIAKSYVEMMGGKITVSSEVGSGSTFTFSIPYTKQLVKESDAKGNITKETQTALNNLSVIIAEDDETSIMFFDAIFKNEFHKITYTKAGQETIDKCRVNPETDLILMDIKMPGMNGYDATREIRKFNSDVIIIAQTAFGLSGDREKAIEAGCNDYISKPIKKDELFEKIIACVNKKTFNT